MPALRYEIERQACATPVSIASRVASSSAGDGRFFDQLLVPPLNRALALSEREHTAVGITENLNLHMPCRRDQLLEVERPVAECRQRLGTGACKGIVEIFRPLDESHSLATSAGRGLQQHGIADLVRGTASLGRRDGFRSRDEGKPRLRQLPLRLDLVAHPHHHVCVGADEDEIVVLARAHEVRVLGEESVAGMHGVAAGGLARGDHRRDVQIALGRGGRPDADRAVGKARVQRAGIGRGVDGDRLDVELVQRADHTHRNLAAVRNEHAREHR